ncbi:hypothetical protein [Bailinhaonella thermotolerans]|uniref:Uncharacterized protein n=1 Tax=Bailinhaonella thermotolerans TaxID=1070861 RepID=A0A3A4APC0_9ACTN|nr:hypothetical protein [Bailinhaonella thermotolerans]RJL21115.1 hypothetical protein D5H75_38550 [Bailinhaonella thermotolerans]
MEPISSLSREYLYFVIQGAAGFEPVEVAFTAPGVEPTSGQWQAASWTSPSADGLPRARILVGPGSPVVLTDGTYQAWVRITGTVEQPVLPCGLIPVT